MSNLASRPERSIVTVLPARLQHTVENSTGRIATFPTPTMPRSFSTGYSTISTALYGEPVDCS